MGNKNELWNVCMGEINFVWDLRGCNVMYFAVSEEILGVNLQNFELTCMKMKSKIEAITDFYER